MSITTKTESEICAEYAKQLDSIWKLDCTYYLDKAPTQTDRVEYFKRQALVEELREAFYIALAATGHVDRGKAESFEVSVSDPIMGKRVVSAPQCLLAHDLMNYVGVIIDACQLLAERNSGEPKQQQYLQSIA